MKGYFIKKFTAFLTGDFPKLVGVLGLIFLFFVGCGGEVPIVPENFSPSTSIEPAPEERTAFSIYSVSHLILASTPFVAGSPRGIQRWMSQGLKLNLNPNTGLYDANNCLTDNSNFIECKAVGGGVLGGSIQSSMEVHINGADQKEMTGSIKFNFILSDFVISSEDICYDSGEFKISGVFICSGNFSTTTDLNKTNKLIYTFNGRCGTMDNPADQTLDVVFSNERREIIYDFELHLSKTIGESESMVIYLSDLISKGTMTTDGSSFDWSKDPLARPVCLIWKKKEKVFAY